MPRSGPLEPSLYGWYLKESCLTVSSSNDFVGHTIVNTEMGVSLGVNVIISPQYTNTRVQPTICIHIFNRQGFWPIFGRDPFRAYIFCRVCKIFPPRVPKMADEDAELPVMTLMFCTTLATIYLSYVFWSLGVKKFTENTIIMTVLQRDESCNL